MRGCNECPRQPSSYCDVMVGWEARGSGESQLFLWYGHLGMSAVGCCIWTDERDKGRIPDTALIIPNHPSLQ